MTKIYILKDGEGGIEDVFDSEEKLIKKVGKEIWDNKTKYTGYGQTAWEDDVDDDFYDDEHFWDEEE